ncbi:MAG: efflux RND transporter permease subunit, partial [Candidatus Binatia bacterium]
MNVRYARDYRDSLPDLRRVLVPTAAGAQIPLGELAHLRRVQGPAMIRSEGGQLASYVSIDMTGRDLGGWIDDAKGAVAERLTLPPGTSLVW